MPTPKEKDQLSLRRQLYKATQFANDFRNGSIDELNGSMVLGLNIYILVVISLSSCLQQFFFKIMVLSVFDILRITLSESVVSYWFFKVKNAFEVTIVNHSSLRNS